MGRWKSKSKNLTIYIYIYIYIHTYKYIHINSPKTGPQKSVALKPIRRGTAKSLSESMTPRRPKATCWGQGTMVDLHQHFTGYVCVCVGVGVSQSKFIQCLYKIYIYIYICHTYMCDKYIYISHLQWVSTRNRWNQKKEKTKILDYELSKRTLGSVNKIEIKSIFLPVTDSVMVYKLTRRVFAASPAVWC